MTTPFEKNNNQSATYQEAIQHFDFLAKKYPQQFHYEPFGMTDAGFPLHVGVVSFKGCFTPEASRENSQAILFINNGIHPGEPEGIDATMMLIRDILESPQKFPMENITICFVTVYNVDGCLRRGAFSRANQVGPDNYGFRGNDQNLDLNRDFVKCDSRNALSFNQLFAYWKPDLFVDNHTSNGADYSYTMTLIPTQYNKLSGALGTYLKQELIPYLYQNMENKGWEMIPYVNSEGETPDDGIYGFSDSPRYSTGYAALHHTIGFMPETHMLKPFPDRVQSTYAFMVSVMEALQKDKEKIQRLKKEAIANYISEKQAPVQWTVDKTQKESLTFKGYEAKYKPSEVSGLPRLWYDKNAPYSKEIPFWDTYKVSLKIEKPDAYILPQAFEKVIERIKINGATIKRLDSDKTLEVTHYRIENFKTTSFPYEGHYLHSKTEVKPIVHSWNFRKGDYVIECNQDAIRYIVETLEPQAVDSYFSWNFFDGCLMQKEGFSSYVFEDLAADFLHQHPEIRTELEEKKKTDKKFAESAEAQLEWVYQKTPYYEPTHKLYPVAKWWGNVEQLLR